MLISFISILFSIVRLIFVKKTINWLHLLIAAIIIYPYWQIFNLSTAFTAAVNAMKLAFTTSGHLIWRWWFLNSYKSVDGINIGWPGTQAIDYYLYNGLILLIVLIILGIILHRAKKNIGKSAIIPLIYLIIFFFFAEIMPRMGMYFLPNRAWVDIMLAAVVILAMQLVRIAEIDSLVSKTKYLLIILIIVGYAGIIYVAKNNIDSVFKQELPAANFIKNQTPNNAVVLSTQENGTLVRVYGERNYGQLEADQLLNPGQFNLLVSQELTELSTDKISLIQPRIVQIIQKFQGQNLNSQTTTILQDEKDSVDKAVYFGNNPVYFIYSYQKLAGIATTRGYEKNLLDSVNQSTYKQLGYHIVYQDSSTIVLQLR
jgi:hypothetical protein